MYFQNSAYVSSSGFGDGSYYIKKLSDYSFEIIFIEDEEEE